MELEKLQNIIAEVLNVDAGEVTMDTTFTEDLGADSLAMYFNPHGCGRGV